MGGLFFLLALAPPGGGQLLSSAALVETGESGIEIVGPKEGSTDSRFTLSGLPATTLEALRRRSLSSSEWNRFFSLHVESEERPPVLSSYRVDLESIELRSEFPLDPGVTYRAVFRPAALAWLLDTPSVLDHELSRDFTIHARGGQPVTVVEAIYPSADLLPENLLKLYLHFSAPMSRGIAYRKLSLLDPHGKKVELPFLELEEELWDPESRRLTVLFDPGRIKSGLRPRREVGPALERGGTFVFRIDSSWPDAEGLPLAGSFAKEFRVDVPDVSPPKPEKWEIALPSPDTREPLVIDLGEPLDHALLHRLVWITRADDSEAVAGAIETADNETRWLFKPSTPWVAGVYRLNVDPWLEDHAGNRVGGPFEIDRHAGEEQESGQVWTRRFVLHPNR